MSSDFALNVETRTDLGKGASRRLRREGSKTLAIVYGGEKPPVPVTVPVKELKKLAESEAFFTSLIDLSVDGKSEKVVVKDVQRHPSRESFMHVDFMRVDAKHEITMHVPIHFINEDKCVGVKMEGGVISHGLIDLEISCLPKDLPEYIEVDMADLKVGDNIHISDLKLPPGVQSVELSHGEDHDQLVSAVNAPRGGLEEEEEDTEAGDDTGAEASSDED